MSSMSVFEISAVININEEGITYIGNNQDEQFIDFKECRKNWVEHVNSSRQYTTWDGELIKNITEADTNCVGMRDWFSAKPYYEFFTKPLVRFEIIPRRKPWEFFNKRWVHRYYPQFHAVQAKIDEFGWTTFDMG